MTIVCNSRKFIFLKTKKTAGSSIELWLAPHLDPKVDLIRSGIELGVQHPELWKQFNRLSVQILLAAQRVALLHPLFRQHMPASEVRRFVGDRKWRSYKKITIVRNPWDRTISLWKWRQHNGRVSISLSDFVSDMEKSNDAAHRPGAPGRWDNRPYYAIGDEVVVDEFIKYEQLESDTRAVFSRLGITGGPLPQAKAGIRKDGWESLTPALVDRIGALHRQEIEMFRYDPPNLSALTAA